MPDWLKELANGWPMIRANVPTFIAVVLIIAGGIWGLFYWAYESRLKNQESEIKLLERQKSEATAVPKQGPLADRARLRLHVYGDTRVPEKLSYENVWRWYHLNTIAEMIDSAGAKKQNLLASTLFISFDQPVKIGTLSVHADKPLPTYEVKEFNNRFAVIVFDGGMPECNLDIEVSQ
jgi:hypothetical protein